MILTNKKFKELLNLNTDIVTLISDRNGRKKYFLYAPKSYVHYSNLGVIFCSGR